MKIINPGCDRKSIKPKRFRCKQCGCEFEADHFECKAVDQIAYMHDAVIPSCICPLCTATVYSYK